MPRPRPPASPVCTPAVARLWRWLTCATLGLAGCWSAPAPPQASCRFNSECGPGHCVSGVCLYDEDSGVMSDANLDGESTDSLDTGANDAPTATDGTVFECVVSSDCKSLDMCSPPFCNEKGQCEVAALADAVTCVTFGDCPTTGTCRAGECSLPPGGKICDDFNPCTKDACGNKVCTHTPQSSIPCTVSGATAACVSGICASGVCKDGPIKADTCFIAGQCRIALESAPGLPCQLCLTDVSQTDWTPAQSGPCEDGDACTSGDTCQNGQCSGGPVACNDNNACTSDGCLPSSGCKYLPINGPCDDLDPCSTGDSCQAGACLGPGKLGCDDGNPCTDDACDGAVGCKHTPLNKGTCLADTNPCTEDVCLSGTCVAVPLVSKCVIGGTCVPAGQTAAGNSCLVCDPTKAKNNWTELSGPLCSDDNACTFEDSCSAGQCIGELGSCSDGKFCTKDSCSPASGCVFTATTGPCEDGNACTLQDHCAASQCIGSPILPAACGDNNPCTDDSCNPKTGCTHQPNKAICNDGNPCTYKDFCNGGKCISGGVACPCTDNAICDDGNPCTLDTCSVDQGCSNLAAPSTPCDDADACTANDHCQGGVCDGGALDCDDGNPCTLTGCAAESGCTVLPLPDVPCNDGNACTIGDLCLLGACSGTKKNCDDGNPCSLDSCAPKSGACEHLVEADFTPCSEDGIGCTLDHCIGGQCNHTSVSPSFCLISGTCLSGGAIHPADGCLGCLPMVGQKNWSARTGLPCSDGNACTSEDLCVTTGQCLGYPLACDDSNPCTFNGCNPQGGNVPCQYGPGPGVCNDDNACTTGDGCSAGNCTGMMANCDDGNSCTADACDAKVGCVTNAVQAGIACADDGLSCTSDQCYVGACTHLIETAACLIEKACRKNGEFSLSKACAACQPGVSQTDWSPTSGGSCDDGNPCSGQDICSAGTCAGSSVGGCDDGNPCTDDACVSPGGCVHVAVGGPCDDANACTVADACQNGACSGGKPKACGGGQPSDCSAPVCEPSIGCLAVSTCGALHSCVAGQCITVAADGQPGAVQIPLDALTAPQPMLPTLRWQDGHLGPTGGIAQLWLAMQNRACVPASGVSSGLLAAVLEPGASQPTWLAFPGPGSGQCVMHPVLADHPATFNHLVLGWLQTSQLSCSPGAMRLALVGLAGAGKSAVLSVPCPGPPGVPTVWRPDLDLTGQQGGNPDKVQDIGGLLVRSQADGLLAWNGVASASWGGSGKAAPHASWQDYTQTTVPSRPVHADLANGKVLFSLSKFTKGSDSFAGLEAVLLGADGTLANTAKVILTSAEVPGTDVAYAALDAVWDPDSGRVAVLLSGTYVAGGIERGFLAFARVLPDQVPVAKPLVVTLFDPPALFPDAPVIRAFRLAELPSTGDFLLAWALPGSPTVQLMRLQPLDDKQFLVKSIQPLATNFTGHGSGAGVEDFGGLSELAIAPDGKRFSLAWESTTGVHLLTGVVP